MKKISVITVSLNSIKTIEHTIRSVICQDYPMTEYIIVDGGSSDGTVDIIKKYDDSISYWISETDNGIYEAMNKGIRVATGDYVLFLNSDDYFIDSGVLSRISEYLLNEKEIVIGRVFYKGKLSEPVDNNSDKSPFYEIFYPHQATFVPRIFYDMIGNFDESYKIAADFEWFCRAVYNGISIKWVDEAVSVFSLGGLSSTFQCVIDAYNISEKYMRLVGDTKIADMTQKTVEKAKTYFFNVMCTDEIYYEKFEKILDHLGLKENDRVQIWGAGFWGEIIKNLLLRYNIMIDCIFDSDSSKTLLDGIPICLFDKNRAKKVIISTEYYDGEIAEILEGYGLKKGEQYICFHTFRDLALNDFDIESEIYRDFVAQTSLHIL